MSKQMRLGIGVGEVTTSDKTIMTMCNESNVKIVRAHGGNNLE